MASLGSADGGGGGGGGVAIYNPCLYADQRVYFNEIDMHHA